MAAGHRLKEKIMISPTGYLHEKCKIVTALAPATHNAATGDWVSLKNYSKCTIIIIGDNATTVTGNSITIEEATLVDGTGNQALTRVTGAHTVGNIDTAAADALTNVTLATNAFTTTAVNAKNYLYVLEVDADDLSDGYDCIAVVFGAAAVATVSAAIYILWPSKYADADGGPTAITD
jgi:hypothetical protein